MTLPEAVAQAARVEPAEKGTRVSYPVDQRYGQAEVLLLLADVNKREETRGFVGYDGFERAGGFKVKFYITQKS